MGFAFQMTLDIDLVTCLYVCTLCIISPLGALLILRRARADGTLGGWAKGGGNGSPHGLAGRVGTKHWDETRRLFGLAMAWHIHTLDDTRTHMYT